MKTVLTALFASLLLAATAAAETVNAEFLLKKLDLMQKMGSDITAQVSIIQQRSGQAPRKLESRYYRRDSDDSFLILMTAPDAEKGNGYLRVGDNMWVYRRNTRSFQHINRDESISGTDMKGGDFEKRKMADLYRAVMTNGREALTEEMLGSRPVYRLEIIAKVDDVTYPRQIIWMTKDTYLPLKVANYSGNMTLMVSQYYLAYQTILGRYFPLKMVTRDEFEKGNQSAMEISGVDTSPIDPRLFTKAKLEEFSQ
ncbi:MAG: outer membrane lipoprotein-sorting protein [Spirochaetes bacterium]|nr:outer membrane lipoprotein-sorting protein [Spirochaetota bacterium]